MYMFNTYRAWPNLCSHIQHGSPPYRGSRNVVTQQHMQPRRKSTTMFLLHYIPTVCILEVSGNGPSREATVTPLQPDTVAAAFQRRQAAYMQRGGERSSASRPWGNEGGGNLGTFGRYGVVGTKRELVGISPSGPHTRFSFSPLPPLQSFWLIYTRMPCLDPV
jgi:hypothetical protein